MAEEFLTARQELNNFLAVFRTIEYKPEHSNMLEIPILKRCAYCGKPADAAPIATGRFDENLCPTCKREMIWQQKICQNLADETTHNVEQFFSISWRNHIEIKKLSGGIDLYDSTNRADKHGGIVKRLDLKFEKWWYRNWEAGVFPQIAQLRVKKNICKAIIRGDTPVGTVVAELVHIILSNYLSMYFSSLDQQSNEGIVAWYIVHYLAVMDYMRYATFYDETLEELAKSSSGEGHPDNAVRMHVSSEGSKKYMELRDKLNPISAPITPLCWAVSKTVKK